MLPNLIRFFHPRTIVVNPTLVQVSPHIILIVSDEVKTRAFNLHVGVDGKLLEQTLVI
jgi:hypothetical protein